MELLSGIVLILLTLVGYSSGKVLAGSGVRVIPTLWDVLIVLLMWVGALYTRTELGKWMAILIWLLIGGVIGACSTILFMRSYEKMDKKALPKAEGKGLQWVWQAWKAFAMRMGDFQGRMLLIWFYFIIVTPFGLLVRLLSDPLHIRTNTLPSYWSARPPNKTTLEDMRRQF